MSHVSSISLGILLPNVKTLNNNAPFWFNKQLSSRIVIALFDYTRTALRSNTNNTNTKEYKTKT